MRKLKHGYYLLFRREERDWVYIYDFFQWHELKKRFKEGWKLWR